MSMQPRNTPKPPVIVEYTSGCNRLRKAFACPYKARRFYALKLRQGKDPHVVSNKPRNA